MPSIGQVELQSQAWLSGNKSDRPSFEVVRGGLLLGATPFRVFALPTGLLFLELKNKPGDAGPPKAALVGALAGGAVGALIGSLVAESLKGPDQQDSSYDMCGEEELFALARKRKRSFVAKYDEIRSISIDAPGSFRRAIANRSLVGWISLDDEVLGRISLKIRDQMAMAVAIEALPRRLGERVQVNVELDDKTRFVPKRA